VHFFLQSVVLFAVLALVQWHVAWEYVPLLPIALVALLFVTCSLGILLSAVNVYLRDTQHFLELALLAWFWVTPIVYAFELVVGNKTTRGRLWFGRLFMLNPVTPIVVTFQRAIYAKLTNPNVPVGSSGHQLLPTWSVWGYLAYTGYAFAFGIIVLAIAFRVFGRSEANFAEEL
jgi:ABC-2 type transport system permease protein